MKQGGTLWGRVFLALFVLAVLAALGTYLARHTLYAWRAAWLRKEAAQALAASKPEEAINRARSAWLVSPGNTESARLLLDLLASEHPREAMQWLLWLEQHEALDPDDITTGATLAFRLNQPAMALFWRNQIGEDADPARPEIAEHDAIMAGLWGAPEDWLDWIALAPAAHLDRTAARRCLPLVVRRLSRDGQERLVSLLETTSTDMERTTLLAAAQVLTGGSAMNTALWPRLWALIRDDGRLSGTERLSSLLAAVQGGRLPPELVRAALGELQLFPSESASLLAVLRFQLGDFKEAADLADDPLTSLAEPWRSQIRVPSTFAVGPAKRFFDTVETAAGLRSSFRLAWRGRGQLKFENNRAAAAELFAQALQTAEGEERWELANLLYKWGETDRARAVYLDLLEHPGLSQKAVVALVRDAFLNADESILGQALDRAQFDAREINPVGLQLCFAAWLTNRRVEEARDWLVQTLLAAPDNESARALLAAIQMRLNAPALATVLQASTSSGESVADPRTRLLQAWTARRLDPGTSGRLEFKPGRSYPPAFPREREILKTMSVDPGQ